MNIIIIYKLSWQKNTSAEGIWATSWENLFLPDANNKGTDQPEHQCSRMRRLISAFVIRCLDTSSFYIQNFKPLASLCSWAGRFESYLVANPEDRFSRDVAQEGILFPSQKCDNVQHLLFTTLETISRVSSFILNN